MHAKLSYRRQQSRSKGDDRVTTNLLLGLVMLAGAAVVAAPVKAAHLPRPAIVSLSAPPTYPRDAVRFSVHLYYLTPEGPLDEAPIAGRVTITDTSGGTVYCQIDTNAAGNGSCSVPWDRYNPTVPGWGRREVVARYAGSSSFAADTDSQTHVIWRPTATPIASVSPEPSVAYAGSTRYQYRVAASVNWGGTPVTDAVQIVVSDSNTPANTCTIAAPAAQSCLLNSTSSGTKTITARFAGSETLLYGPSQSSAPHVITSPQLASVTLGRQTTAFTENQGPLTLDPQLGISHPDIALVRGAVVSIASNYQQGDILSCPGCSNGITAAFNAVSGQLTLSGDGTTSSYANALRSVAYTNALDTISPQPRTVHWIVTNPGGPAQATSTITINAVDDAPTLTSNAQLRYRRNSAAVPIDANIELSDPDNSLQTGAVIRITTNYKSGQDVLACATCSPITARFDPATGTLTLAGNATLEEYRRALRSVTYANTSAVPDAAVRTVSWSIVGPVSSNTTTSQIAVDATNAAPVITAGATLSYQENQVAAIVDSTITVSDADDQNLIGAVVKVAGGYAADQDLLSCPAPCGGLNAEWNTESGTLSLTGTAPITAYRDALRAVVYYNTSDDPKVADRRISWSVSDGISSAEATSTIKVANVRDAPVLSSTIDSAAYVDGNDFVILDPGVSISDVDSSQLGSADIWIQSNYLRAEDRLHCPQPCAGLASTFDEATGHLTIVGNANLTTYQSVLRSIGYENLSVTPNTAMRQVKMRVFNALQSNSIAINVSIATVDQPPVVEVGRPAPYAAWPAPSPRPIDPTVKVSDADSANITSAQIRIERGYIADEDRLSCAGSCSGLSQSFDAGTGTLTLAGSATPGTYQAALRQVSYSIASSAGVPTVGLREIVWTVSNAKTSEPGVNAQLVTGYVIPAMADTFIRDGSDTNNGRSSELIVNETTGVSGGSGATSRALIKFDLAAVPVARVSKATLRFRVNQFGNGSVPLIPLSIAATGGESWADTLTWATRFDGLETLQSPNILGSVDVLGEGDYSFDVTAYVNSRLRSHRTASLEVFQPNVMSTYAAAEVSAIKIASLESGSPAVIELSGAEPLCVDTDSDGACDAVDSCPTVANWNDQLGAQPGTGRLCAAEQPQKREANDDVWVSTYGPRAGTDRLWVGSSNGEDAVALFRVDTSQIRSADAGYASFSVFNESSSNGVPATFEAYAVSTDDWSASQLTMSTLAAIAPRTSANRIAVARVLDRGWVTFDVSSYLGQKIAAAGGAAPRAISVLIVRTPGEGDGYFVVRSSRYGGYSPRLDIAPKMPDGMAVASSFFPVLEDAEKYASIDGGVITAPLGLADKLVNIPVRSTPKTVIVLGGGVTPGVDTALTGVRLVETIAVDDVTGSVRMVTRDGDAGSAISIAEGTVLTFEPVFSDVQFGGDELTSGGAVGHAGFAEKRWAEQPKSGSACTYQLPTKQNRVLRFSPYGKIPDLVVTSEPINAFLRKKWKMNGVPPVGSPTPEPEVLNVKVKAGFKLKEGTCITFSNPTFTVSKDSLGIATVDGGADAAIHYDMDAIIDLQASQSGAKVDGATLLTQPWAKNLSAPLARASAPFWIGPVVVNLNLKLEFQVEAALTGQAKLGYEGDLNMHIGATYKRSGGVIFGHTPHALNFQATNTQIREREFIGEIKIEPGLVVEAGAGVYFNAAEAGLAGKLAVSAEAAFDEKLPDDRSHVHWHRKIGVYPYASVNLKVAAAWGALPKEFELVKKKFPPLYDFEEPRCGKSYLEPEKPGICEKNHAIEFFDEDGDEASCPLDCGRDPQIKDARLDFNPNGASTLKVDIVNRWAITVPSMTLRVSAYDGSTSSATLLAIPYDRTFGPLLGGEEHAQSLDIPITLQPSWHRLDVRLEAAGDADTSNNERTVAIRDQLLPDLVMNGDFVCDGTPVQFVPIGCHWRVANTGMNDAGGLSQPVVSDVSAQTDGQPVVVGRGTVPGGKVAVGTTATASGTVVFRDVGVNTVYGKVDPDEAIVESSEGNNFGQIGAIDVKSSAYPMPDIKIDAVVNESFKECAPPMVCPSPYQMSVTVFNAGNAYARGAINVEWKDETGAILDTHHGILRGETGLAGAPEFAYDYVFWTPGSQAPGAPVPSLTACASISTGQGERTELNNCATYVVGQPDYYIDSGAIRGDSYYDVVVKTNQANWASGGTVLPFKWTVDGNDLSAFSFPIANLATQGFEVLSEHGPPRTSRVEFLLNPGRTVGESNFSNNKYVFGPNSDSSSGGSVGDPHVHTFDGGWFDFHRHGEYVLASNAPARGVETGEFIVQVRQQPMRVGTTTSRSVSVNTAVAAKVGRDTVAVYGRRGNAVLEINGNPQPATGTVRLLGGGAVSVSGDGRTLSLVWPDVVPGFGGDPSTPDGTALTVTINSPNGESLGGEHGWLDVRLELPTWRAQTVRGLLGNFDGESSNDATDRAGAVIPPGDNQLSALAAAWSVLDAVGVSESLFTAKVADGVVFDPAFPYAAASARSRSVTEWNAGRDICLAAGVPESSTVFEDCVYDEIVTGLLGDFARAAAVQTGFEGDDSGLLVEIYNRLNPAGTPVAVRREKNIDATYQIDGFASTKCKDERGNSSYPMDNSDRTFSDCKFSQRFKGLIVPPMSGQYGFTMGSYSMTCTIGEHPLSRNGVTQIDLQAGREYPLECIVVVDNSRANSSETVRMTWRLPGAGAVAGIVPAWAFRVPH